MMMRTWIDQGRPNGWRPLDYSDPATAKMVHRLGLGIGCAGVNGQFNLEVARIVAGRETGA